jgi:GNAT superfamily N-acetyltransferase
MTAADKPAIMTILNNTPEFPPSDVVVAEELIDCYLHDPSGSGYHIVVGEDGSAVAGYACYGITPLTEGTWDLYWIAVERIRQGQGVGAALMKFVEDWIREEKGRMLLIETSSRTDYEKTRRFYINFGYQAICQITDFYAPGDSKVVFMKRFNNPDMDKPEK